MKPLKLIAIFGVAILIFTTMAEGKGKPGAEMVRYKFTYWGDVTGEILTENQKVGPHYEVGTSHGTGNVSFSKGFLDYAFLPGVYGRDCVRVPQKTHGGVRVDWDRDRDWSSSRKWFPGRAGNTSMLYLVDFFSEPQVNGEPPIFSHGEPTLLTPPSKDSDANWVYDYTEFTAYYWALMHEGHGKLKGKACTGEGVIGSGGPFPNGVKIRIERIELLPE